MSCRAEQYSGSATATALNEIAVHQFYAISPRYLAFGFILGAECSEKKYNYGNEKNNVNMWDLKKNISVLELFASDKRLHYTLILNLESQQDPDMYMGWIRRKDYLVSSMIIKILGILGGIS